MDATLRALNRFGLGARIGERRRINDPHAWLRDQLTQQVPAPLAAGVTENEIANALRAFRMIGQGDERARREARQRLQRLARAEQLGALALRITSDQSFTERLVAFWSNHLCVSTAAKLLVAPLAGSYEREVVRKHVFGRFEDMVLASARHPAMLIYLDNFQSVGPRARGAQLNRRAGRQRGLNENYARELLELHTLGVDGGYTQTDVIELARMLTGWTVDGIGGRRADGPIRFAFNDMLHEPGGKTLLGARYHEDGAHEGERAIRALCRHPSTARFVARKLATHFIADTPPTTAVDRLAKTYRETDGDLRAVSAALIELPEVWSDGARKLRTPQDWIVAVLRAFAAREVNEAILPVLRQLRHPLWSPQAPKGFGDTVQEWADPDSLLNRAELARTMAQRLARAHADPRELLDVVDVGRDNPLRAVVSDIRIPAGERIALAIAGPAFQWR
ncbi:MAG TPA: DUF1800 domain-containing protein [Longimicrobiales bacterium]|nr:DUF1800 domain-containing protein [Longimicrobiales bacterium]